jgi:hypothetical protein
MVHSWDAKRIASVINISTFTVRKHIANIYEKLHINSKAQAMSLAHKENLVSIEGWLQSAAGVASSLGACGLSNVLLKKDWSLDLGEAGNYA